MSRRIEGKGKHFKCDECGWVTGTQSGIYSHFRNNHPKDPTQYKRTNAKISYRKGDKRRKKSEKGNIEQPVVVDAPLHSIQIILEGDDMFVLTRRPLNIKQVNL